MIDKKGQLRKMLIVIISVLLITIGIITAQNIINEPTRDTAETDTNTETETTDNTTETINLCENINCSISTLICPDNFIATCENSCISETGSCTSCTSSCKGHEAIEQNETETNETTGNDTEEGTEGNETTQPEQNETTIPITGEIIETETPQLDIQLSYPPKITRSETLEIKAIITNSGAKAKKVIANWILPQNFEIISGSLIEDCENLNKEESCISTISIQTSFSTPLGKNQIKIIANYEK